MADPGGPSRLYTIYGLTFASDIALPELSSAECAGEPDVVIRRGDVPQTWRITDPCDMRSIVDGTPEQLWLRIPDVLRMSICGGNTITYALEPGCEEDDARLFLLGSGLGAMLMQRGYAVVHGNAITLSGRGDAIMCIGDSGAGKSTTAIAMMQRGYAILADDVCPIGPDGRIEPGMPRAKLWQETAGHLGIDTSDLRQIRAGDAKYNLPLGERHCQEPRAIGLFVWLVPGDVDQVECSEVTGVEKFTVLRNNIYRPEYLRPLGLEAAYLRQVAQIAGRAKVFRITRPQAHFDIDPLLDTIAHLYDGLEDEGEAKMPRPLAYMQS